ncbi:heme oxygenase [Agrobacterium vitis]|nr:heme oxygenase [Agrobacterium vitis]
MAVSHRRQMLRRGTAQMHNALDAMIGAFSSHRAYEAYVLGTARFRLPLESTIKNCAPFELLSGWQPSLIGDAIRADISALGLPTDEPLRTKAPKVAVPQPETIDDWLGVFYVLEGSSLGAKLLVRRLDALNINHTNGGAHLATLAKDSSNWSAFLALLDTIPDVDEARMIHWANATFSFAHQAFETVMEDSLADH